MHIEIIGFAGIAFLRFMGVARELLGRLEEKFFSTVFTGSGLLFWGMVFAWAAIGATIVCGHYQPVVHVDKGASDA